MKYPGTFGFNMPFYRAGDRLGCSIEPNGYSGLKKSGVLARQYCMKCSHRCWIYFGPRYRYLETKVKVMDSNTYS